MDRKEVIKWLKIMKANLNSFPEVSKAKKIEALAEAIRLLKNEQSIEPRGSIAKNDLGVDCISREKALGVIRNLYPSMPRVDFNGSLRKWADKYKPYIECEDAIKELPSVTPIRPKGHWDIKDNMWWICSACGCQTRMMKKYNVPNFCPACGAEMVEPQESEDKG